MFSPAAALRCFYFAYFVAIGAYLPYFPSWLAAQGIDGVRMGILSSLLPALTVLGPPGFGMLADALGMRGSLLRFASLGACVAFGIITVCAVLGRPLGFGGLFLCVLMFGFFRTPMQVLSDVLALEQGGDYGRQRLFGSLGFMVTAPIVGRYVDMHSPVALPLVVGVGLVAGHLATWPLPKHGAVPSKPPWVTASKLFTQSHFRVFLLVVVLAQGAHVGYDVTLSLHLSKLGFSGSLVGIAWAIGTAAEVILMATAAPLLARYNPAWLLLLSLVVGTARWALMGVVQDPLIILLLQPLHGITFGLRWLASVQIIRGYAPDAPSTVQGLHLAAFSTGSVLGTLVFGGLYSSIGGHLVFWYCALTALIACAVALPLVLRTPSYVERTTAN